MNRTIKILFLSIALTLCLFGIMAGCQTDREPDIRILVSANTNGIFEPCDCEVGPIGGLAKRATLMNKLDPDRSALRIDVGGITDELTDPKILSSVLEASSRLEYDAVVPGACDEKLAMLAKFKHDTRWFFSSQPVIINVNEFKIKVIAFSNLWIDSDSSHVKTIENNNIDNLSGVNSKNDHDLTIWLTFLDDVQLLALIDHLPAPDFILAGGTDLIAPGPEEMKGVPVYRPSTDGIDIVEISVVRSPAQEWEIIPAWHEVHQDLREHLEIKEILDIAYSLNQ